MSKRSKPKKYIIHSRSNTGDDTYKSVRDKNQAIKVIESLMTINCRMVCVEINGTRTDRWDRERVVGSNEWIRKQPEDPEILGKIRLLC